MNAEHLRALVHDFFRDRAAALSLDPRSLRVEYVLNWGGFVNYSYRIRAGHRAYHLKLARTDEDRAALRRWFSLAARLERYHAPPVLDWIEIGPAAGLLFPHVAGQPPALDDAVVAELLPVLQQLNRDEALAHGLRPAHVMTARDVFMDSFHDRFTQDLHGIRETPPPFVSAGLVQWMEDEVSALARSIAAAPAFAEPLSSPVHGDLWLNNILWTDRTTWCLLDWDDLHIGDPAADLAALCGPDRRDLRPFDLRPIEMRERVEAGLTPTQRERLPHLSRATLLDWIIDPLSDWIDADTAPEHQADVRAEKERLHRTALHLYRQTCQGAR